jgi:antirestriction protein ArdC
MDKEKLRDKALKKYAELMIEKIKGVEASDWKQPWFGTSFSGQAQNINGRHYSNFNQILLSFVCEEKGYKTPVFITFNQAKEIGTSVLKGEKGFPVNFYTPVITDKEGNNITLEKYSILSDAEKENYTVKHYTTFYHVFNIEQTNFKEIQPEAWEQMLDRFSIEKHAQGDDYVNPFLDKLIKEQKWVCPINLAQQDKAFYSWKDDAITLPTFGQFPDKKEFYYTALHEMAHSTGHQSRLNRTFGQFGDASYSREELVAELTSAFAGKQLDMNPLPRKENAQYLKSWLQQIDENPEFLYKTLKDVGRSVAMIEESVSAVSNKQIVQPDYHPVIMKFYKDNDGVINATVKDNDLIKDVVVYPRGNEYCFTLGNVSSKNMQTYFLSEQEVRTVKDLLSDNILSKVIKGNRKTLVLDGNTATIDYSGKKYDASDILKTLEANNIKADNISISEWERLLKGQGLQLDKSKKAIFSIAKTPSGYGMKIMSVAKNITKSANIAAEP